GPAAAAAASAVPANTVRRVKTAIASFLLVAAPCLCGCAPQEPLVQRHGSFRVAVGRLMGIEWNRSNRTAGRCSSWRASAGRSAPVFRSFIGAEKARARRARKGPGVSLTESYARSIALHPTARAGRAQVRAQLFGTRPTVRPDGDSRPAHAAAREPMVNDAWLAVRQDRYVPLLQLPVSCECRRVGRASDQFRGPGVGRFGCGCRWAREKASHRPAWHRFRDVHLSKVRLDSSPLLGGLAGYDTHIGARLARQVA